MKKILLVVGFCLVPILSWADTCAVKLMPAFTAAQASRICGAYGAGTILLNNDVWLQAANATPSGTPVNLLKLSSANNTHLNAIGTSNTIKFDFAKTPVAVMDATNGLTFQSAAQGIVLPAYVPTMVATPVAGTNMIQAGMNIIPTAAANAAAIIGASTPVPGTDYYGVNTGANTVRIKAGGGATLNGATAGGWLPVGTLASFHCKATSATNYNCELPAAPTPQGP